MVTKKKFSENLRINVVIENILDELCPFLEEQARAVSSLTQSKFQYRVALNIM